MEQHAMQEDNGEQHGVEEDQKEKDQTRPRMYLVGEAGGDHIRNELSTKPPKKVFEEIQHDFGLQLPDDKERSELPVLDLLDLHKVTRTEVHLSVLSHLRAKLLERIDSLPMDSLEKLLELTFPYIGHEELRDVPLAILKRHSNIPATYLRKIGARPEVYSACSIQVQRQIWQVDEDLFKARVFPLLGQYINTDLDTTINEMLLSREDLIEPRRRRENNFVLQQLVQIVGKSVSLYNKMLHFFRTLFVTNRDLLFCTLRSELLMALHDQGISEIYDIDPCHKFAWCIDACVRDHIVEERRVKEMQTYFVSIPPNDPMLGDLGMIIADPNCTNTLLTNIFSLLTEIVDQEKMPSENANLKFISKLLALGLQAREMIEHQSFQMPDVDGELLHVFYPMLARKILEDMAADEDSPAAELDSDYETIFKSNLLARKILLYYLLTRIQAKDIQSVKQILSSIDKVVLADEPSFVQSLITQLLSINDKVVHTLVVDEFLIHHIHASPATHKQFLRYLLARHTRFSAQELILYLKQSTSDVRDRDKVRPAYDLLKDRLAERLNDDNAPFLSDYLSNGKQGMPKAENQDQFAQHGPNKHDEGESLDPGADANGGSPSIIDERDSMDMGHDERRNSYMQKANKTDNPTDVMAYE